MTHEHVWATKLTLTQSESDALSRATRDAAEKFTADAIAAGVKPPEDFREYPEDYFDPEELKDSDSYRDFVNQES